MRSQRRDATGVILIVTLAACSSDLATLQREAIAIAVANQPRLDALVARVHALQRDLCGNLPGWEPMWRTAELANDELGLPPFAQTVAPDPSWQPSPATLLGMRGYVRDQAEALARHHKRRELAFLVEDERRRYEQGLASVDSHLCEVERWLVAARERGKNRQRSGTRITDAAERRRLPRRSRRNWLPSPRCYGRS